MTKYKLEYIWLDGYTPVPNLRGKTQIKEFDSFPTLEQLPLWGFDGSSTMQAEGHSSDCVLKPVAVYPDGARTNGVLVMCEVMMPDGKTPHATNKRATILDDRRRLVRLRAGVLLLQGRPSARLPRQTAIPRRRAPTTPASATRTSATSPARSSRSISTSASPPASTTKASTPRWPRASGNSRSSARAPRRPPTRCGWPATSCMRLTEKYGIDIEFHCKPLGDTDWNGSGMHANFSTTYMREVGGKDYFEALMKAFEKNLKDHIAVYGPDNDKRLTGKHETAPWNKFSYGVADRGASIRVPHCFVNNGYKGYLEDRRPNSQGDPYQIASQILKTIASVPLRRCQGRLSALFTTHVNAAPYSRPAPRSFSRCAARLHGRS